MAQEVVLEFALIFVRALVFNQCLSREAEDFRIYSAFSSLVHAACLELTQVWELRGMETGVCSHLGGDLQSLLPNPRPGFR